MSKELAKPSDQTIEARRQFVREWGRMSDSWGINRTMAQIHALLLASDNNWSVEELMDELHISRGNASMNLRDLIDWGIIQRNRNLGDRKDLYRSYDDVWSVFGRVARERKRREIDPTVSAIQDCLGMIDEADKSEEAKVLRHRLEQLLEIFGLIDRVFDQIFKNDALLKETIMVLRNEMGDEKEST